MDSTLLVYELAKKGYNVWAYSFDNNAINQRKVKKENEARKRFLRFAKLEKLNIYHRHIKIKSEIGIASTGYVFQGIILCAVMPYLKENCDIVFGFVRKDCFWKCCKDFTSAFYAMARIFEYKNIKLLFPWKNFTKKQLVQRFMKSGIPIECIWVCENPKRRKTDFIKCGKCLPCKRNYL